MSLLMHTLKLDLGMKLMTELSKIDEGMGFDTLRASRIRQPIEGGDFVLIRLDSRDKMVTMKFM